MVSAEEVKERMDGTVVHSTVIGQQGDALSCQLQCKLLSPESCRGRWMGGGAEQEECV